MNLNDRFLKFCRQYPGAESIDDLVKPSDVPPGTKIADFLFQARTVVCEVKTLTKETVEKLVAYMQENGIGPSNLSNGQHKVKERFLQLEEGEEKYRQAIARVTTPLLMGLMMRRSRLETQRKYSISQRPMVFFLS